MKKIILSALTLSIVALPTTLFAQEGEGPMENNRAERMYQELDTNEDGKITKAEFDGERSKRFNALDTDKNNIITPNEFQEEVMGKVKEIKEKVGEKANVSKRKQRKFKKRIQNRTKDSFKRLDANGDHEIGREEFEVAGERLFRDLDANSDGSITKVEAQFGAREMRKKTRFQKAAHMDDHKQRRVKRDRNHK